MKHNNNHISDELLAAFLDGNTTPENMARIINAAAHDPELREMIELSGIVDADMLRSDMSSLPMMEMAAYSQDDCMCAVECETYILQQSRHDISPDEMRQRVKSLCLLKDKGMPLYNIGRLSEDMGMSVTRRYDASVADLEANTLAVVDWSALNGDKPNGIFHAVVIKSISDTDKSITIFDPSIPEQCATIGSNRFNTAWTCASNYLVTITDKGMKPYIPHPIDLSDIELDGRLTELREAIAENAHEVWAENRQKQGWSYGPKRDDDNKETPDMVPYSDLPEAEKLYDREMAINTLKLVQKLGYEVFKKAMVDDEQRRLALIVRRVMLRTDIPDVKRLTTMLYDEVMINESGSFMTLSKMLERQAGIILGSYLNPALIIKDDEPVNTLPPQLTPQIVDEITDRLVEFQKSESVTHAIGQIMDTIYGAIEKLGWHYGVTHLPETITGFREKLKGQIRIFNDSINLITPLTDLQPLYQAAARITIAERIRNDNHEDISEYFRALYDNALKMCTRQNAIFSRNLLSDIIASREIEAIIDKNIRFRANCMLMTADTYTGPAPRFFTDPDIITPNSLNI